MTTPTPNVVNMKTAARLIREAKEAREKRKRAREAIDARRKAHWDKCRPALDELKDSFEGKAQFPGGIDDLEV